MAESAAAALPPYSYGIQGAPGSTAPAPKRARTGDAPPDTLANPVQMNAGALVLRACRGALRRWRALGAGQTRAALLLRPACSPSLAAKPMPRMSLMPVVKWRAPPAGAPAAAGVSAPATSASASAAASAPRETVRIQLARRESGGG